MKILSVCHTVNKIIQTLTPVLCVCVCVCCYVVCYSINFVYSITEKGYCFFSCFNLRT